MSKEKYHTIKQEIEKLGVEYEHFDKVYSELKENQQLPSGDIVPWSQYTSIVNYLRDNNVLDEDNKVDSIGLEIFETKKSLEAMLDNIGSPDSDDLETMGGVLPCTNESERPYKMPESNGGMLPCRSENAPRGGMLPCRY